MRILQAFRLPRSSVRRSTSRPFSNLPSRTYNRLVGRKAEVDSISNRLRAADPGRNPIVLIHGASGVGKTSLALEVAFRFLETYDSLPPSERFEVIIWISAQPTMLTADGFSTAAFLSRTLEEVVTIVAITANHNEILKALPEEQVPLVYKALSEQRTLIVADNLETMLEEKVFDFLRRVPPTTKILATSRVEHDLGEPRHLDPLGREASLALIKDLAKTKRVDLNESQQVKLLGLTGGIPLGIVWSIALMHYGYGPEAIFESLAQSQSDILRFCFDKAWEAIRGHAAETLLFSLALFSYDASRTGLGFVAGLDREMGARDEGLILLERLSLIDRAQERFSALPMTKAYTAAHLATRAHEELTLRHRWADYLFLHVRRCSHLSTWAEVFRELDTERENIFELLTWASKRRDEAIYFKASVVFHDLAYYLYSRGYWHILISNGEWATIALWEQGLIEEYLVVLLSWITRVHIMHRNTEGVKKCFTAAEKSLETLGGISSMQKAIIAFNRASVLRREGRDADAVDELSFAIPIFREDQRPDLEAMAHNRLGNTMAEVGRFEEAESAYQEVVNIASRADRVPWANELLAEGKGNLGILANRLGKYDQAIRLLTECEPSITQVLDKAIVFMELAIANYHRQRLRKAVTLAERSLDLVADLNLAGPVAESEPNWETEVLPKLKSRRWLWQFPLLSRSDSSARKEAATRH